MSMNIDFDVGHDFSIAIMDISIEKERFPVRHNILYIDLYSPKTSFSAKYQVRLLVFEWQFLYDISVPDGRFVDCDLFVTKYMTKN